MAKSVRFRNCGELAIVTIDAPEARGVSGEVRAALWDVIAHINAPLETRSLVLSLPNYAPDSLANDICCEVQSEIRANEGSVSETPDLAQLCDAIDTSTVPIVALLQGVTLGQWAEIATAARYRVATARAYIGFPDILIGLLPGAGATQRLPRVIGATHALHLLTAGEAIAAQSAYQIGLIDAIVGSDPQQGARDFAQNVLERAQTPTDPGHDQTDRRAHLRDGRAFQSAVVKARATLAAEAQRAPLDVLACAIDCVEMSAILPMQQGLEFEADAAARCRAHPQSRALAYLDRAERRIDDALIVRIDKDFVPVAPMGKSAVVRLFTAWRAAADHLVGLGFSASQIDGAAVAFGHSSGPFGGRVPGSPMPVIEHRLIAALVVEGAACVAQGAVQRLSDIDVLCVHGFDFPRFEGGPMHAAQTIGLNELRRKMQIWARENRIWEVPELMDRAVESPRGFDLEAISKRE